MLVLTIIIVAYLYYDYKERKHEEELWMLWEEDSKQQMKLYYETEFETYIP